MSSEWSYNYAAYLAVYCHSHLSLNKDREAIQTPVEMQQETTCYSQHIK